MTRHFVFYVTVQVRDNYLVTIDNIQQADPIVILESQMTMNTATRYMSIIVYNYTVYRCIIMVRFINSTICIFTLDVVFSFMLCVSIFHRILDSLGTFLDTVDLATVNTTNNLTTLTFNTYAVQIQEVDPDNFAGQTFVVNLGPVAQAMNISGNIAQESLITLDGVAIDNSRRKRQSTGLDVQNATASLQLTPLIFENCVSNMSSEASTIVSQRLSYSVFVSDVLFQTENNIISNIVVGSIVVAVRLRCQLANKTMLSVPVRSTFQVAEMVDFVC